MQKADQSAASPSEMPLIPLNKLRLDARNVRSASDDPATVQADAELIASIKAQGLLENLVVVPRGKTQFGVAAGARRLRALKALAAEKAIPKDHPVPCRIVDGDAATESSLAENAVRIAMHPADQVVAFSKLAADGATAEQIAARFGIAERTVQKRVRLGGLASEIIDAYREGRINADTAEAFAVTADTEFQRNIFKALEDSGQLYGHAVRHAIGQRRARSDAPTAVFVGIDAYRAAGGITEDPLFEDDYIAILDPDLMEDLAIQKLNAIAAKYADDWKWTAAQAEFSWMDRQNHLVADPARRAKFTDEETAALAEAEERIERADDELDAFDSDLDTARRRELWDIVAREQNRYADIKRARADRHEFSDAVRASAGVVVALDNHGNLDIHRGLVRAEDAAAYRAARAADSGNPNGAEGAANPPDATVEAPAAKKNGGYTDALRNDFRVTRGAAERRALARDPAVATDLLGFVLARMVGFGRREDRYEAPILAIRKEHQGVYASDAMKASETMKHLDPVPAVDLGWLAEEDAAASFRAYRALPDDDRASVLAHAVASLFIPRLADDRDASGAHEQALRDLDIDFPAELAAIGAQPFDADLVWNRMSKALILGAASETLGDDWAAKRGGLKKKDLVAAVAEAFRHDPARDAEADAAAVRWLPPGFAPADAEAAASGTPAAASDNAEPDPETDDDPTDAEPATGDGSPDAPADAATAESETDEQPPAADPDGNGALPAFLTS